MTDNKIKIANALLGNPFNKPIAAKVVVVACELATEATFVTKIDDNKESLSENFVNDTTSINIMPVGIVAKRACKRYTIYSLFGLPRAIVLAIYQNCKLTDSNVTNKITIDYLVAVIGSSKSCIKTTINRLKTKQLISTEAHKTGRGGWAIYRLSEVLYRDIAKMEASRRVRMAKGPNIFCSD